jgi:hypothetical protein
VNNPQCNWGYETDLIITLSGFPKNKTDHVPVGNSYGVKGETLAYPQFHWGLFTGNSYGVLVDRAFSKFLQVILHGYVFFNDYLMTLLFPTYQQPNLNPHTFQNRTKKRR